MVAPIFLKVIWQESLWKQLPNWNFFACHCDLSRRVLHLYDNDFFMKSLNSYYQYKGYMITYNLRYSMGLETLLVSF